MLEVYEKKDQVEKAFSLYKAMKDEGSVKENSSTLGILEAVSIRNNRIDLFRKFCGSGEHLFRNEL